MPGAHIYSVHIRLKLFCCSVFLIVRSSLEISALESERRKLRSKVEMFQRQVRRGVPKGLASYGPGGFTGRIRVRTF